VDDTCRPDKLEVFLKRNKILLMRQEPLSGQTLYLRQLSLYLNAKTNLGAVFFHIPCFRPIDDITFPEKDYLIPILARGCGPAFSTHFHLYEAVSHLNTEQQLEEGLKHIASCVSQLGRKMVLFVDELEMLEDETINSALRFDGLSFLARPSYS
jgi:hypothetical protein